MKILLLAIILFVVGCSDYNREEQWLRIGVVDEVHVCIGDVYAECRITLTNGKRININKLAVKGDVIFKHKDQKWFKVK